MLSSVGSIKAAQDQAARDLVNIGQLVSQSASEWSDKYTQLKLGYDELYQEKLKFDAYRRDVQKSLDTYRQEVDKLNNELRRRQTEDERNIRAAQKVVFDLDAKTAKPTVDDHAIQFKLRHLYNLWDTFARIYSRKDIAQLRDKQYFQDLGNKPYVANEELNSPLGIFAPPSFQTLGRLLLLSEIAHYICTNIADTAFLSLIGIFKDVRPGEQFHNADDVFTAVFEEIRAENVAEAYAWRSRTLEHFQPVKSQNIGTHAQRKAGERRKQFYEILCQEFDIDCQSSGLYKDCHPGETLDRQRHLMHLIQESGEYFAYLHTLGIKISLLSLDILSQSPFGHTSDLYESHARMELDEGPPDRCDGMKIQMVVVPAIVAQDVSQSGEQLGPVRTWMKAIVWANSVPRRDTRPPVPPRSSPESTTNSGQLTTTMTTNQNNTSSLISTRTTLNHVGQTPQSRQDAERIRETPGQGLERSSPAQTSNCITALPNTPVMLTNSSLNDSDIERDAYGHPLIRNSLPVHAQSNSSNNSQSPQAPPRTSKKVSVLSRFRS